MEKKQYMQPATEIIVADMEQQLLEGSPDPVKLYDGNGDELPPINDKTLVW